MFTRTFACAVRPPTDAETIAVPAVVPLGVKTPLPSTIPISPRSTLHCGVTGWPISVAMNVTVGTGIPTVTVRVVIPGATCRSPPGLLPASLPNPPPEPLPIPPPDPPPDAPPDAPPDEPEKPEPPFDPQPQPATNIATKDAMTTTKMGRRPSRRAARALSTLDSGCMMRGLTGTDRGQPTLNR